MGTNESSLPRLLLLHDGNCSSAQDKRDVMHWGKEVSATLPWPLAPPSSDPNLLGEQDIESQE